MPIVSKNSTNGKSLLPQNTTITKGADGSITLAGTSLNASLVTSLTQGLYDGIVITNSTIDGTPIGQKIPSTGNFTAVNTPTITSSTCLYLNATTAVTIPSTIPLFLDGVCSTVTVNRPGLVGTAGNALELYGTAIDLPNSIPLNLGSGGAYSLGTVTGSLYQGAPSGMFVSTNQFNFQNSNTKLVWNSNGGSFLTSDSNGGLTICAKGASLNLSAPDSSSQVKVSQTSSLTLDHQIPLTFVDAPRGQITTDTNGNVLLENHDNNDLSIGITIPTQTRLNIGSSTATSHFPPQVYDSNNSGYTTNRTLILRNLDDGSTQNNANQRAIVISSDLIIFEGDVEFKKSVGQVEYETVKSQAPILYIGNNTVNNHFDRGVLCVYDQETSHFVGYQEREEAFVFLRYATVGSDDLVRGTLSRIEVSGIDAGSSSPSFTLGSTTSFPVLPSPGGKLLFGSDPNHASYLDSQGHIAGLNLTLETGQLNLGTTGSNTSSNQSIIKQDSISGDLHFIPSSANTILDKGALVFSNIGNQGSTSASSIATSATLALASNDPHQLLYQNINQFQWTTTSTPLINPSNTSPPPSPSTPITLGFSLRLADDGMTPVLYFEGDCQLSGDNLVWAGVPIPSSGGGGGGGDGTGSYFTTPKTIPFVASTSGTYKQLITSTSLQFDATTNTLSVNRLHLGTAASTATPNRATDCFLYQDSASNGTNNLVLTSPTGIQLCGPLYGNNQVAHIPVATTFDFQDTTVALQWKSSSSSSNSSIGLQGNSSTHSLILTDPQTYLAWGSDQAVGFNRLDDSTDSSTHLYFRGQFLHVPISSQLSFGTAGTIQDTGNSQTGLQIDANKITFSATTQVQFQGDVSYTGRVTLTNTDHLDINSNFLNLGASRQLSITSIVNGSAANVVNITTSGNHGLQPGTTITINGEDCVPSLTSNNTNNTFTVQTVLAPAVFSLYIASLNNQPLTKPGTTGVILAPLTSDPGTDVGLQFSHFNTSAQSTLNGFLFYQRNTQSYVLADDGQNNNDVIQVNSLGTLTLRQLNATYLGGPVSLRGSLNASTYQVSGSNFQITGGSIDNWTTSTSTLITNLNSQYLNGLSSQQYVHVDGSIPLTQTWNVSATAAATNGNGNDATIGLQTSFLDVWNLKNINNSNSTTTNQPIVFIGGPTQARLTTDSAAFYYNTATQTLVSNVDVSTKTLTLANGQVPPAAIGPGVAGIDISGNSATVTNGVYKTDYTTDSSLLVADRANQPYDLQVPPSSVAVTDANGHWSTVPVASLSSVLTIERLSNLSTDSNQPTMMNPGKQWTILKTTLTPSEDMQQGPKYYFVSLPNGIIDGAPHIFSAQLNLYETIQVQLPLVTATTGDSPSFKMLYLTNGCSCEVIWDGESQIYIIRNTGGYFPCENENASAQ